MKFSLLICQEEIIQQPQYEISKLNKDKMVGCGSRNKADKEKKVLMNTRPAGIAIFEFGDVRIQERGKGARKEGRKQFRFLD